MTAYLLDANALIALTIGEHEHHERASEWLAEVGEFALCPITEGALVRFVVRMGESATTASALLAAVRTHPRCRFWPDAVSYADLDLRRIRGHRQVTDTYLVGLAADNGGKLATLDGALAAAHQEDAELIGG